MNSKDINKLDFKINQQIAYPTHGVGVITAIEIEKIANLKLQLYVIKFAKEKMILRVPIAKTKSIGMRELASNVTLEKVLKTLKSKPRIKRTMWSRRAQEYEAKINSGDILQVAEVVRDLYRNESQPEQSYSERQLYEIALERLSREIGAIKKINDTSATACVLKTLNIGIEIRQKKEDTPIINKNNSKIIENIL